MKIAIMMRPLDQDTGHRFFLEGLLDTLLEIDQENEYLLIYRTPKWFGRYLGAPRVEEVLAGPFHKAVWDQAVVPYVAWKHGADVIFHSKFSVPLLSSCPVVMGLQEPAWWAHPEHHSRWDVLYTKTFLPLFCRKASHLLPWTNFQLEESRKYLRLPLHHATVTYGAPNQVFRRIQDRASLEACRAKYGLPERFVLTVTRVENIGNEGTTFSDTKNPATTILAYLECRDAIPHALVVAGRNVREYLLAIGWSEEQLRGIYFPGLVPQDDLARLYNLADLFVLASFYEGFGLTIVEAMACGCPVIASRLGACPETAGGAAVLADPYDYGDYAAQMKKLLSQPALLEEMRRGSLERAAFFNWEKTARAVLAGLTRAARGAATLRAGAYGTVGFLCEYFRALV